MSEDCILLPPPNLASYQSPRWVCAVQRRRFPVGASPTRQPLQPEATGAVMEVGLPFDVLHRSLC